MTLLSTLPAIAILLLAAASDIRSRRIPNELCLALAALGLVRLAVVLATGAPLGLVAADLLAALSLFALGAGAFALRLVGGGDVKLIAAASLWLGAGALPAFLLGTALAGGLLACLYLALARRGAEQGLPYGVAIAAGALAATLPAA